MHQSSGYLEMKSLPIRGKGNINLTQFTRRHFLRHKLAVYIRDRNKEVVYNGVTEYEELISFMYVDRTVYLNAGGFNIQPVKITNGYFS